MNMRITALLLTLLALASWPRSASAITFSGTDLSTLHYSSPPDSEYVPAAGGDPDLAALSTADSGPNGDAPVVYARASNPLINLPSLGTLSGFSASYDLYSSGTANGNQPYWLTYLNAPGGGYVGVVSFGGPDLNDASQIHVFYDFDSDPNPHTTNTFFGNTLSFLDTQQYDASTTFGQLSVYEAGVEIGDWADEDGIASFANIDSITVAVPEASTWAIGALAAGLLVVQVIRARAFSKHQAEGRSRIR